MMGSSEEIKGYCEHPELKGIIPRTVDYLYNYFENNKDVTFSVTVSFVEIYLEKIKDLLDSKFSYYHLGMKSVSL